MSPNIPIPFGLSLSKPSTERSEVASRRSALPFDFAQGERGMKR
ncbi:putative protein OS=Sphingobium scionense OX=1404341 GN=GGQ90_001637 PE=4 SV=1 [Sphingobium scionense]|uniref:Uncharacterized protein n=1 Tax=Sphingobium scionense TaxID=1404341 RepID=A0A7W6LP17_9SPHN|nr:hypothetical protein [Sphingobium scionense]